MTNDRIPTPEDTFGRRLRQLRERLGLTQADLARLSRGRGLNLHPSAIAKIEARDASSPRAIRLNEAAVLADAVGRSVDDLVRAQAALWDAAAEIAATGALHIQEADREFGRTLDLLQRAEPDDLGDVEGARASIIDALDTVELLLEGTRQTLADLRGRLDGEHLEAS